MKKIELHLHLDGSLDIDYASEILGFNPSDKMISKNDNSLKEYLDKFHIPQILLNSYDNICEFSYLLAKKLQNDNVIYAEIRFCPSSHNKYISLDDVVNAVLKGLNKVKSLKSNLIFCMRRNYTFDENLEIINLAEKYLGHGCCAIDLVGDEASYDTQSYRELFEIAKSKNIPFTIHAGEADSYKSVDSAISFGTNRIGHGINSIQSDKTIKKLIENNITLEICPKSNMDTKSVESISKHPIKKLYDKGVLITINTDNITVSNTSLDNEYKLIKENFGFTDDDLLEFNLNAINAAFISEYEKEELRKKLMGD